MFTFLTKEELIKIGSRFRGKYLLEQATITELLLDKDLVYLKVFLPDGFSTEWKQSIISLEESLGNKELIKAEAKENTIIQGESFVKAKQWARILNSRANIAYFAGVQLPDVLLTLGKVGKSVPKMIEKMTTLLKAAEENISKLSKFQVTQSFIAEGWIYLKQLQQADAVQEFTRIDKLPKAVKEFYYVKGLVYIGLKMVNHAAFSAFSETNSEKLSGYNLHILYRRTGERKKKEGEGE